MQKTVFVFSFLLLTFSCKKDSKQTLLNNISKLEKKEDLLDKDYKKLNEYYLEYSEKYPKDSMAEVYLYNVAIQRFASGNQGDLLYRHLNSYPESNQSKNVLKSIAKWHKNNERYDSAVFYYEKYSKDKQLQPIEWNELLTLYSYNTQKTSGIEKANWLLKESQAFQALGSYNKAVEALTSIVESESDFKKMPEVLNRLGFINWEYLKKPKQAEKYYKMLVANHPDAKLAKDAQIILDDGLLFKSEEDLLKHILNKNK